MLKRTCILTNIDSTGTHEGCSLGRPSDHWTPQDHHRTRLATRQAKMLQTGGTSSIQRRRTQHRRQQSLEVPILATPLPPNPRRTNPGHRQGHRRGLSLDQSLNAATSPGFRPLLPQDTTHGLPTGHPSARTPTDTNPAYPPDQQHLIKQETQQHSLAQPGYHQQPPPQAQQPDFQSHLHQQLNGIFNPSVSATNPEAAAAMQSLQHHMAWYEQNFGGGSSPHPNSNPNMQQQAPFVQVSHPVAGDMAAPVFLSQQPIHGVPVTPVSHGQARTVPNTPQAYVQSWPSPPLSNHKHTRSQSYQLDVAPMSAGHENGRYAQQEAMFNSNNGSFSFPSDQDYAASAYSSSIADPSSPPHQHGTPMPTLFEEPAPGYHAHPHPDLLLQATGGAEHDFNSPHFMMGGGPMCPEQAALDAAGIDATYIDTGITEEHINSLLVHPTGKGEPYRCKWEGCNTKINRKENARSHVQNHLDDRRFRCNPCGKRFNRLHDTKRHHLTHTNERPAICPCGKTFARADALTRHRQRDMCEGVLPGFEKTEEEKPKRGRPKKDRSENGDKSKRSSRPDMDTRARKAALARSMDQANGGMNEGMSSTASVRSLPATPPHDSDDMDADFLAMTGGSNNQYNQAPNTWLDTPPTSPPSATPTRTSHSKVFIDMSIPEEPNEVVSPSKLSSRSSPCPANGDQAPPSLQESSSQAGDANTLFADYSSPPGFHGATDFTGESSPIEPGVDIFSDALNLDAIECHPDVGHDAFSPPGESCSGSSVYHSDWDTINVGRPRDTGKATRNVSGGFYSDSFGALSTRNPFPMDDFMTSDAQYDEVRDMLDSWVASH